MRVMDARFQKGWRQTVQSVKSVKEQQKSPRGKKYNPEVHKENENLTPCARTSSPSMDALDSTNRAQLPRNVLVFIEYIVRMRHLRPVASDAW